VKSADLSFVFLVLLVGCNQTAQRLIINRTPDVPGMIVVSSSAFRNGEALPAKYTTTLDLSPPVEWKNVPAGTKSFVLLMEDADVPPPNPFLHWVMYNIPANVTSLPEAIPHEKKLKLIPGAIQGKNSQKRLGYGHPSPIDKRPHHYHIEIFALDDLIDLESGKTKSQVVTEMNGHVLGKGELVCTHRTD
jgi:Raf kinase inhibitor-like YbhB/YbcL family protein